MAPLPLLPALVLAQLLTAVVAEHSVSYTLVSAGRACTNEYREVSPNAGSPQNCAELVCADPMCGTMFQDRSAQGGSCSCLGAGQTCVETMDTGSNRYEITDTSTCEPRETNHDCFVMVYEMGDFTGWSASFPEGSFGVEDFYTYGALDDSISSMYISGEGCSVTVYGHTDFTGWSATFPEGSYSAEDLVAGGAPDDDISSMIVHYGDLADLPDPKEGAAAALQAAQAAATEAAEEAAAEASFQQRPPPSEHHGELHGGEGEPGERGRMAGHGPEAVDGEHAPLPAPFEDDVYAAPPAPVPRPPPRPPPPRPPPAGKRRPPPARRTADTNRPSWAAKVPMERWQDIPAWARKHLLDERCEPVAKANCDAEETMFIDRSLKDFCGGAECSKWAHRHDLEDEAKRIGAKRMDVKPAARPWVEKRSAILWALACRITDRRKVEL